MHVLRGGDFMGSHKHACHSCHSPKGSNVKTAFLLNFGFAILEIIGGVLTNSSAILSDAIHDFGDSLSLGLSYLLEKLSTRKHSEEYTYGLKRLSLIGAVINIAVLLAGTYFVLTKAVDSFFNPEPVNAMGMLLLSIVGISINGLSVWRMKGSKKILDKTVTMHLLEDLYGWIAAFVVSITIYFTEWYLLDSILAFFIVLIIMKSIYHNTKSAIAIVMQSVPDKEMYHTIKERITQMDGVKDILTSNMWTLDGEDHVFTATVMVSEMSNSEQILKNIKSVLEENDIHTSTIELTYSTPLII